MLYKFQGEWVIAMCCHIKPKAGSSECIAGLVSPKKGVSGRALADFALWLVFVSALYMPCT